VNNTKFVLINLYRPRCIFDVINYVIVNDVEEHCYFVRKYSLDSISLEIVNRRALSYVLVQVTAN